MAQVEITPTKLNGKEYYTVTQFAVLMGCSPQNIYHAIKKGKGDNALSSITMLNQLLIPATELDRLASIK